MSTLKTSLSNRNKTPETRESFNVYAEHFKLQRLTEIHASIMAAIFIASSFCILTYINITVIHLLTASRIFVSVGLAGFFVLYFFRKKLNLSLLDGLFYNLFGTAPLLLSVFLIVNAQCSETFTETYEIVNMENEGSGFTYELSDSAYQDFWRIRNLSRDEANNRYHRLKFTVCNGSLGYKVIRTREMIP